MHLSSFFVKILNFSFRKRSKHESSVLDRKGVRAQRCQQWSAFVTAPHLFAVCVKIVCFEESISEKSGTVSVDEAISPHDFYEFRNFFSQSFFSPFIPPFRTLMHTN